MSSCESISFVLSDEDNDEMVDTETTSTVATAAAAAAAATDNKEDDEVAATTTFSRGGDYQQVLGFYERNLLAIGSVPAHRSSFSGVRTSMLSKNSKKARPDLTSIGEEVGARSGKTETSFNVENDGENNNDSTSVFQFSGISKTRFVSESEPNLFQLSIGMHVGASVSQDQLSSIISSGGKSPTDISLMGPLSRSVPTSPPPITRTFELVDNLVEQPNSEQQVHQQSNQARGGLFKQSSQSDGNRKNPKKSFKAAALSLIAADALYKAPKLHVSTIEWTDDRSGRKVRCGTLIDAVAYLASDINNSINVYFLQVFFGTQVYFASNATVVRLLKLHFLRAGERIASEKKDSSSGIKAICEQIQLRVINIIRKWFDCYNIDFRDDPWLCSEMHQFLSVTVGSHEHYKRYVDSIVRDLASIIGDHSNQKQQQQQQQQLQFQLQEQLQQATISSSPSTESFISNENNSLKVPSVINSSDSGVSTPRSSIGSSPLEGLEYYTGEHLRSSSGSLRTRSLKRFQFSSQKLENCLQILDFEEEDIVKQFTIIESANFAAIHPRRELIKQVWNKHPSRAPGVVVVSTWFNKVAYWAAAEVCFCLDLNERAAKLKKLIKIAYLAYEWNNLNLTFEIVAGLSMGCIFRLKNTWEELSSKSKARWKELESKISSVGNFIAYRKRLEKLLIAAPAVLNGYHPAQHGSSGTSASTTSTAAALLSPGGVLSPGSAHSSGTSSNASSPNSSSGPITGCVPYLGLILTDLTFAEEGAPTFLSSDTPNNSQNGSRRSSNSGNGVATGSNPVGSNSSSVNSSRSNSVSSHGGSAPNLTALNSAAELVPLKRINFIKMHFLHHIINDHVPRLQSLKYYFEPNPTLQKLLRHVMDIPVTEKALYDASFCAEARQNT